jgi:2-methylcitrate dehydratase PrpD
MRPSLCSIIIPVQSIDPGFSKALCEQLHQWTYETLPADVVRTAKRFVLDTLGVIAAAGRTKGIPELTARLCGWDSGGRATVLLGKKPASPLSAAVANGAAAHALDFDDQHDPARVHAYCVCLPAVLAAAEEIGNVDGKRFLLGLVTAIELHARLGLACHDSLRLGWQPTVSLGGLAASLGVGRLLGLSPTQLLGALGLAYHQAAGNSQSLFDNAVSKRLGPGFAARSAVLSGFLASDGVLGPTHPLEGDAGLFRLYERGTVDHDLITAGLGEKWELLNYSIKPFPSCRCNHSVIDLALALHAEGVRPEEVRSAAIFVSPVNRRIIGTRYDPNSGSVVHAQFNAAFSFARALADGKFDLSSLAPAALSDSRVAGLTAVMEVHDDPSVPGNAIEPVRIDVTLKDGRRIERSRNILRGGPQEPLSNDEVMGKFRTNLEIGLGASAAGADRLAEAVLGLEFLPDAGQAISAAFPNAR